MTTWIGGRWKRSDAWSRAVLITRKLPYFYSPAPAGGGAPRDVAAALLRVDGSHAPHRDLYARLDCRDTARAGPPAGPGRSKSYRWLWRGGSTSYHSEQSS